MKKLTAVFASPDKTQTMTVVAAQGKKAINVKASVKTGKGKGTPKATPGARESFQTQEEATLYFDGVVEKVLSLGWVRVQRSARNAFTVANLPAPSTGAPVPPNPTETQVVNMSPEQRKKDKEKLRKNAA